jgi:rSAM/selenodomain-associated transferase 1
MAKAPIAGAVKKRLARGIGAVEAAAFYRHLTAATLRRLSADPRWRTLLAVTPDRASSARFSAWPASVPRIAQGQGDLGDRMQRIFDRVRRPGPLLIAGSDVPGIACAEIAAAFRALGGGAEAVIGPSGDGGYWLIGLGRRARLPRAFRGVRWSSEHALGDTLRNLGGAPLAFAATRDDVDDARDFENWRRASAAPKSSFAR